MNLFFIGIKGSGMSALSVISKQLGHEVSGVDVDDYFFTQKELDLNNIKYCTFEDEINFENYDLVIVGNAYLNHDLVQKVENQNIKWQTYFGYLNEIAANYTSIAISGTNGKTTTTGLAKSLLSTKSAISLIGDGHGYAPKDPSYFIYEACEYRDTFLNYNPDICIINNIEMDHPDFFKDLNHVIDSFQKLANNCKTVILNVDDKNCQTITHDNIVSYGIKQGDIHISNYRQNSDAMYFDLHYMDQVKKDVKLELFGIHMLYNALATITLGIVLKLDIDEILNNVAGFKGTTKRFEITVVDQKNEIVIVDDYAHHPTAIDFVYGAVRQKYPDYLLTVLFQPHTYSRTQEFLNEFAVSLEKCDNLFIEEIFGSARESVGTVSSSDLRNLITNENCNVVLDPFEIDFKKPKQVILLLGAGIIDTLYKDKIINLIGE